MAIYTDAILCNTFISRIVVYKTGQIQCFMVFNDAFRIETIQCWVVR